MSSKYEELAKRAVATASRLNQIELLCQVKAGVIARRFAQALGAPEGAIETVDLDQLVEPTNKVRSLNDNPEVQQGQDGRWYFGVKGTFGQSGKLALLWVLMRIGIRPHNDAVAAFSVGLLDQPEHEVKSEGDLDAFVGTLIRHVEEALQQDFMPGKRTIGFVADGKAPR